MAEWTTASGLNSSGFRETATDFVSNGIAINQGKGEAAVAAVKDLTIQIGDMLNAIANPPQATASLATLTTHIDPLVMPPEPVRPDLSYTFPNANTLVDVVPNFPIQQAYVSTLVDQLKTTLTSLVQNLFSTGLNPVIEQQIWDRARERTTATAQGLIDSVRRQSARSGWMQEIGDEVEAIYRATEAKAEADITESRNIAVAQADLEQKNFQFSIQQANALETLLSGIFDSFQQRTFEAEKTRVNVLLDTNKIGTEIYKTEIEAVATRINAIADIYKADTSVFTSIIGGQAARIDAQAKEQSAELNYAGKKADIDIAVINSNVQTFLSQKELSLGTLKTIAQIWSQLAASFGSAVHYNAGVSASGSDSYSASDSSSVSTSYSHSISE
jgi:hypothetical protein